MYTLPLQPFRDCRIIIFEGGFWARGLEYELIDDFCYTLIVIRTLGHILRQILVAKIPISHGGDSNPRTSDLESDTLAPYQQAAPPHDLWEFLQPKFDVGCGLRYD